MNSNRVFQTWSYTVSHSTLIIRSAMKFEDQEDYDKSLDFNIDIEFSAVMYMDIPNVFNGIEIREEKNITIDKFKKNGFKLFEIKSNGTLYYILAGGYRIGKNQWISEDRILNMSLEYDEIIEEG
jgi:hypothetical protein